jgi:hypothetical protein
MVMLGAALVALGVAALVGVSLWPAILIAIGGVFILSTVFGLARKHPEWYWCGCWPYPYREGRGTRSGSGSSPTEQYE